MNTAATTEAATTPKEHPLLTKRQAQVLAYCQTFLRVNHQLPPCASIAKAFDWASPNAAQSHLKYLEAKGALTRNELGNLMLAQGGAQ